MNLPINPKSIQQFSRFALFFDYFAFGLLKIIDRSPAAELVTSLQEKTIPFIDAKTFLIILGISECLIGISLLIPKLTKYAIPIMLMHLLTTFMPLILLPSLTWNGILEPTLAGQYIMKNVVLIALALTIYVNTVKSET